MNATLGILRAGDRSAAAIAGHSRAALDASLAHPARLWVAVSRDESLVAGAFQRTDATSAAAATRPLVRRGSGGPAVLVGQGTVHVALSLAHPGALVACDEKRIVNRSVRPLLRALTRTMGKSGVLAHYFGRDWISVAHRPAAWVGFAHDASTRRTLFEAFVAVRTPFAAADRASFLGKPQGTLEELAERPVDTDRLVDAIVDAYSEGHASVALDAPGEAPDADAIDASPDDPPWTATAIEAIGLLGAGPDARGALRVGGDLLVSRDALARLEAGLADLAAAAPDEEVDAVGQLVDATLAAPGVALDGVKTLASVRDVIVRARRASLAPRPSRP